MKAGFKILISFSVLAAVTFIKTHAQSNIDINRWDPGATKSANENSPVLLKNGMVFNSDKERGSYYKRKGLNDTPIADLYYSELKEDGNWGTPKLFSEALTTEDNDGPISFNFNEDLAVFARNIELSGFGNKRGGSSKIGLFFTTKDSTGWSNITPFQYNDPGYNLKHPCLGPMGDILYFASDKTGGFGGFDLYVSKLENGRWTEPVNLGPVVNSSAEEVFPSLHATGRLYFSSNGHDNSRDFDIFYTENFKGRWFPPVKLTSRINSGLNEYTYYVNEDFSSGYFTSNRRGTVDIFTFQSTIPQFEYCKMQQEDNYCYAFYEENTVSLDTTLYAYEWNLGDGTRIMKTEAEHCYGGPGDYLVELNVVDRLTGIVEFNQAEYLVEVRKIIQPYIVSPDTMELNQQVQMDGTNSYLGAAKAGEFYWDFGDGEKFQGARVQHLYRTPGEYTLKLGIIEDSEDPETAREFCSYKIVVVQE